MAGLRRALGLAVVLALAGYGAAACNAAQQLTLTAGLTPERLGAATTLSFKLQIAGSEGRLPSPLTRLDFLYPDELGIATSGLGVKTCNQAALEFFGSEACPADSLMGAGTALAGFPVASEILEERGRLTSWMGALEDGQFSLLFNIEGSRPVESQIVLRGLLVGASPPFGGRVVTPVPVLEFLEGDVSLLELSTSIGTLGLTYYHRAHGRRRAYRPRGILLPRSCPRHGFQFAVTAAFLDGTSGVAHAAVPCPRTRAMASERVSRR